MKELIKRILSRQPKELPIQALTGKEQVLLEIQELKEIRDDAQNRIKDKVEEFKTVLG